MDVRDRVNTLKSDVSEFVDDLLSAELPADYVTELVRRLDEVDAALEETMAAA